MPHIVVSGMNNSKLLTIPANAARFLLRDGGVHLCRPMRSGEFIKFCKARGVAIDQRRLLRFERLGIFSPLFRVYPSTARRPLSLPLTTNTWFRKGYARDTSRGDPHHVPERNDDDGEAYYSRFQIASLSFAVSQYTIRVNIESFLEGGSGEKAAWQRRGRQLHAMAENFVNHRSEAYQFRPAIDLLCQFISDRYFPHTRGNQRTRIVSKGGFSFDRWLVVNGTGWDWELYTSAWKPALAEKLFELTPARLRHAYEALSAQQSWDDPLENWYQLVQFVSPRQRDRLKGSALGAETMRAGALMLRFLHRDLYGEELPPPNELHGTIITHVPELGARTDVRRYMELVVNRFDLNPAPKLTLFVEGDTEKAAVAEVFEKYFGAPAGTHQIEIINLGGVDNATGGKADRFRAILRLIDYLHYHQTFTFLILDNENHARKLKEAAKVHMSTLHRERFATRPEYIKVWKSSFEFDNFSNTEIAQAMNFVARGHRFAPGEIAACRNSLNPGAALSALYRNRTSAGINKLDLSSELVSKMFDQASRRRLANRPLIKTLERVVKLAALNPFPTMEDSWQRNQSSTYFGRTRRPPDHKP